MRGSGALRVVLFGGGERKKKKSASAGQPPPPTMLAAASSSVARLALRRPAPVTAACRSLSAAAGGGAPPAATAAKLPPLSLTLGDLRDNPGATKVAKRKGRGEGSGLGRTAGRGMKGRTGRTGGSVALGFEGGQTPLHRRTPKIGYMPKMHATPLEPLNLGKLQLWIDQGRIDVGTCVRVRGSQGESRACCACVGGWGVVSFRGAHAIARSPRLPPPLIAPPPQQGDPAHAEGLRADHAHEVRRQAAGGRVRDGQGAEVGVGVGV